MHGVVLHRDLPPGRHRLRDLVDGLDASPPLCALFGGDEACARALDRAEAVLEDDSGYMWVSPDDGAVHVSLHYWRNGDALGIYLDLVHELVHVKQWHDGQDLFDERYAYVDRPTELEAYRVAVAEARRLGMDEDALFEFLYVEWIDDADHRRLCEAVGVPVPPGRSAKRAEWAA